MTASCVTVQQANLVGRLDPMTATSSWSRRQSRRGPTAWPQLEGRRLLRRVGANKVASIDGKTMEIKEYRYLIRARGRAASRSDRMTWSGTRISHAASRPARSQQRRGHRMAIAERAKIGTFTASSIRRARSGTTNRREAEHDRAVRSESGEIPDLGDPDGGDIVAQHAVTPDGNPVTAKASPNQVGLIEVK